MLYSYHIFICGELGIDDIQFDVKPVSNIQIQNDFGVLIRNPPYGERIGSESEVQDIYKTLGSCSIKNMFSLRHYI
jgi:putative N6-adenine-specific DNA methylase